MKNLIIVLLGLQFIPSNPVLAFDGPNDVYSKKSNATHFVKVERLATNRIRFSDCHTAYPNACDPIGRVDGYSYSELKDKHDHLKLSGQLRKATVLTLTVAAAGASGYFLGLTTLVVFGVYLHAPVIGGIVGTGMTAGSTWGTHKIAKALLAPNAKQRQAESLNDDVISDQMVYTDNIDLFIQDLSAALS